MKGQQKLEMFDDEEKNLIETTYTKKIDVPLYTPTYKKPSIHELADYVKTSKLEQLINDSNVSDEEKKF